MGYTHLSIIERSKLEIFHQQGHSSRANAKELGRHPLTIYRNWSVCRSKATLSCKTSPSYQARRKVSVSLGKWSSELAVSLEEKLQATWSPEQITERLRTQGLPVISFKIIYRWIYEGRLVRSELQVLRHKGKRRKPTETRANSRLAVPFRIARKRFVPVKYLALRT